MKHDTAIVLPTWAYQLELKSENLPFKIGAFAGKSKTALKFAFINTIIIAVLKN
jgi:hypothetical protein